MVYAALLHSLILYSTLSFSSMRLSFMPFHVLLMSIFSGALFHRTRGLTHIPSIGNCSRAYEIYLFIFFLEKLRQG